MRLRSGRFITFEGGEGVGKSTQLALLKARLEEDGREVVGTREPGGSPQAERIREFLLGGGAKRFGPFAETLLFASARADHVDRVIRPALARGAVVVCDRFIDSTRVYQGALGSVPAAAIAAFERIALGGVRPDLTLVFDAPAAIGMARAVARRRLTGEAADRFEREGAAFHAGVAEAFWAIAAAEPGRCRVIAAGDAPEIVAARVWDAVGTALAGEGRHGV